ncbi:hypothetical protein N7492_007974 [Penicillium capsulatum]|uniref:Protoporphyrinogen oxidase n=1 Tax=Penicillium capsulatum TaxID=69766 RepID=A0A9W9LFJ2_9EURO|nr:hypothetical protein N7492_007974 [Penicillium capsulatum]KAJ6105381.1 hypothetical protein N7512_008898 [Penicillium capsulatum]
MRTPCISKSLRIGRRSLASLPTQQRAYNAAVVGGGITGLTATWQLAQDPQCSRITLYEKSPRLGGWLDSETVPVEGGNVVFEYGPRTLRSALPGSLPLLYLVITTPMDPSSNPIDSLTDVGTKCANVGLFDELICTSRRSPAALNRFIYYPDRLVRLPMPDPSLPFLSNVQNFLQTLKEPLFDGFVPGVLLEHTKPARMPHQWQEDESVASFISRRFNSKIADNLVSAMMHGIYSGDIDKLSAQTILGPMRNLEDGGILYSALMKAFMRQRARIMDDYLAVDAISDSRQAFNFQGDILEVVKKSSTFTFKGGVQQLAQGIAAALTASGKVDVKTDSEIQSISKSRDSDVLTVQCPTSGSQAYDHVIATLPTPALTKLLGPTNLPNQSVPNRTLQKLQGHDYATTVMVVNLYYPDPKLLSIDGFGYLIPRSIPVDHNPEFGLGVIFASASSSGEAPRSPYATVTQDSVAGTKLTVMLGGHYWDGWQESDLPDHDSAVRMARTMLQRHLGITDTPTVARSRLQRNAIPQYTVGHLDRMYDLSKTVKADFNQRLVLAGNWYNGIGVGECVRQGILAATHGIRKRELQVYSPAMCPWKDFDHWDWDMRGGIATAPVRLVDV